MWVTFGSPRRTSGYCGKRGPDRHGSGTVLRRRPTVPVRDPTGWGLRRDGSDGKVRGPSDGTRRTDGDPLSPERVPVEPVPFTIPTSPLEFS